MADDLGAAVLFIEVDDSKARKSIDALRQAVENFKPEFKGVERALTNIASQADKAKVQVQTLNQTLNQAPGASYSKISAQIGRLIAQSRELKIQSEQYIQTLQRIRELEFVRSARAGRQRATADFGAAQGATLTRGFGAEERLPTLPPTIAGDLQKLNELNFRLKNLEVGSSAFELTLRQIEAVQKRVADATEGSSEAFRRQEQAAASTERRLQKLAQIQQYYADINPRAGGTRDPNTGAMLARGAGAAADERAYRASLRAAQQLLDVDLKRLQTIRQLSQQLGRASAAREASLTSGFGAFSASIGSPDPTQKAIRRASERRAQQEDRRTAQLDALDADLARVREQRIAAERNALRIATRAPERGRLGALGAPLPVPPLPRNFFGAQRLQLNRRRNDIASNALIGGAFPLLFGQGIGASLGGAAGGAGGGAIGGQFGFGLSLLGTAVGAQFDAIIQKATLLGKALRDPIASFGELQQAGLLSSRGLERQVEALIAVGANASAAAVIQRDLANSYGGAEAARAVIESQDQLNRSWSEFSVNLGQLALPVFAAAAEDAASSLSGLVAILRGIGNLELPQLPSRVPDAGALSRSFLRVAAGTAGGGPAGFFNAVGGEVTRLFGRNRPDAQKQAADAVTNAQVRIQRIENLRLATQGKQLKSIAAQAQGYNAIAASLDKDVKVEQKRADILDAERRFGEVQGDSPKADAERAEIQREINRLKDEEVRIQQSYNELAKAAAADSARQLALTKELVQVNPEERGFVQQRFDIRELQRQLAVTRAAAAADPTDTGLSDNVTALENQLLQKQLTLQDQLLRFQRDRAATSQLQIANYGLEAQALDRQFAASKRIAAIPVVGGVSTVRDTVALRQDLAEQVANARANEARITAQIQAEQLRGGDGSAERIQQLQLAQVNAARETRNAAFDAATRLADAGRSLRQQIEDATRSIRSTLEGSFELLRPGVQRDLLAQARGRINFSLFDVGRVRTPSEIFAAANASESIAQQENIINQANIASAGISKDLVNVNTSLAAATQRLADKNWNVSVNVLGASGAQIIGDVVNANATS